MLQKQKLFFLTDHRLPGSACHCSATERIIAYNRLDRMSHDNFVKRIRTDMGNRIFKRPMLDDNFLKRVCTDMGDKSIGIINIKI